MRRRQQFGRLESNGLQSARPPVPASSSWYSRPPDQLAGTEGYRERIRRNSEFHGRCTVRQVPGTVPCPLLARRRGPRDLARPVRHAVPQSGRGRTRPPRNQRAQEPCSLEQLHRIPRDLPLWALPLQAALLCMRRIFPCQRGASPEFGWTFRTIRNFG